jgi:hypothetical protein
MSNALLASLSAAATVREFGHQPSSPSPSDAFLAPPCGSMMEAQTCGAGCFRLQPWLPRDCFRKAERGADKDRYQLFLRQKSIVKLNLIAQQEA